MGTTTISVALLVLLHIFGLFSTEGTQVPQFLKRKYGNQYGQYTGAPGQTQQTYTKTKTKTRTKTKSPHAETGSYSGQFVTGLPPSTNYGTKNLSPQRMTFAGGCSSPPPNPLNAAMRCSAYSGCRADCIPNYQFPNGQTMATFQCRNGQWMITDSDLVSVTSCEPICLPQCQNNGICIAPNQCNCAENFSGPQCQFQETPCLNYPYMPLNSRRTCNSKTCTISCMNGHIFPDGSAIATLQCKNGNWVPSKEKWTSIPDCQATCDPPCENGGNCLSFNVCQCPQDYRGPQCQYNEDACSVKKLGTNAAYNCSGDADSFSCSISCPEGIQSQFPPESVYTCHYSTGVFTPNPIPRCIYPELSNVVRMPGAYHDFHPFNGSNIDSNGLFGNNDHAVPTFAFIPENQYGYSVPEEVIEHTNVKTPQGGYFGRNEFDIVTVEQKLPKPGTCFHWGGIHYKTFDDRVYSFNSKCAHILVRDAVDHTFSIITKNHEDCYTDAVNCHKVITIFLQDRQYFLKRSPEGFPVFGSGEKILPIPGQVPGIRIEMSAHHLVVSLDVVEVKLRWDGQHLIQVEVQENLWNRTEGLCGRIDGDPADDLVMEDGHVPKNLVTFASSWKAESLGDKCDESPAEERVCEDTGVDSSVGQEATKFCKKVMTDRRFAACQKVVDIYSLYEACRSDYCRCKDPDRSVCACESLNVYVRDCTHEGIKSLMNWRDDDTCPMRCTDGKVYKPCGPATSQPACGTISEIEADDEATCVEGCFCPEGTVLNEGKCITRDKCPCSLRGKSFPPGSSVPKGCNTCTCNEGQWICTQVDCGARCSAIGDPHYVTFDGKKFDFMGQCSYYLVKSENFSIEAENTPCAGSISQAMNFPASVSSGLPSCTKTVTIKMKGHVIRLKQNHEIVVDGQDIPIIPFEIADIRIRSVSSIFLLTKLPNGIEIWWDGMTRVYVDLPAKFAEKTRGLCGTFNDNQKDDFITPQDDIEQAVIPFANKWKTSEKCNDLPEVVSSHPCDKNIQKKATAVKYCSKIKSDLFKDCHWFVDPDDFYQDCLYDMCSCEFKVSRCLCPVMSSYATECSARGVRIDWRQEVRECGLHCPGGQQYQVCGNSCTRTCFDIAVDPGCKRQCAEGCNCPEGQALDEGGECVPIGQCKCQYDGLEFPPGYREVRPAPDGPELCSCNNAIWQCQPATPEEMKMYPNANDLSSKCNASANMEFTTCEPVEPVTCKNMHSPDMYTTSVCHAGCKCKKGHVLDTVSKRCVKPTECPCHHGGKSYKENSTVQSDCNTCLCQNGRWKCSDRQCTAECSAWGDSHYKTFDGKQFDYQGQCDYILAKGSLGSDAFDVTIQNVPCGSLGTSCSKSISVKITSGSEKDSITLEKDKLSARYKMYKHLVVRQKGLYVIVEAPELGLSVHWDKGTRVYVKIDPKWKDKTKGLCGNYNDNEADDFLTPSGGLAEASANIFGDSWRLQPYCPEAQEITDTCVSRPDRKVWATKQCGAMKSAQFAACHSEVPVDRYFEKCVFDSCACDQGGDCECLCTALAAYAHECNNRGVPVKWRSQELCPIQCDERCTTYSPCVSTCPEETCEDLLVNKKISKSCSEDTCIEGCAPKSCPPGHIYANSTLLDCIPRNECKPICMEINNKTYYEGDLVEEDDCHTCYCSREKKICNGEPCPTTQAPEKVTHQMEQFLRCTPGWSNWINQDTNGLKAKKRHNTKEVEPLPTAILLNNLEGSSKCNSTEMIDIECRTVGSHLFPKETGLDVECSLERGLICTSQTRGKLCPDFEIRVLCYCGEESTSTETTTTYELTTGHACVIGSPSEEDPSDCSAFYECAPGESGNEWVLKTCGPDMMYHPQKKICDWPAEVIAVKQSCEETLPVEPEGRWCPPGQVMNDCAIECDRLCVYYSHVVKRRGECIGESHCHSGCVSANKTIACPKGMMWLDENTCVSIESCLCVDGEGKPMKPGVVRIEDGCRECQCINNVYSCHEGYCTTPGEEESRMLNVDRLDHEPTLSTVLVTTLTPPPPCEENRYMDLLQGDSPLSDEAFSASSMLTKFFAPSNARLDSTLSENSGGSWAPKYSNQDQYLQVDFGRQEPVYGVVIRGSPLYDEYVTSYKVLYSPDGHTFQYVLNDEKYPMIFRGSIDTSTPVKQIFNKPIEAKVIRINPQTWNNGISLRVEFIGCSKYAPTTPQTTFMPSTIKPQFCDDPMGVGDGTMADEQISTSSEISRDHSKQHLKLNDESSWQPLTNSPTEWIMFDFLEPRNVTGLVTKGGDNGRVTAYTVQYSHDNKNWNPVVDKQQKEILFLGNYESHMPQVVNFDIPINTRYLKVIPHKWKNNIQMRVEIHGCFKPYPIQTTEYPLTTIANEECNYCPGVEGRVEMEMDACRCLVNLWWDGENCVNRTQCPCMVGYIPYAVGSVFEQEDCSECLCKIGGVPHCTPKKCTPCAEGLRSTVTSTCGCTCQPCPENTTLCPTSNICIDSNLWCNGVQNCPDDELNCVHTTEKITTAASWLSASKPKIHRKECPVVTCQPGYKKVLRTSRGYLSPIITSQRKAYNRKSYTGYKTKTYNAYSKAGRKNLQRPMKLTELASAQGQNHQSKAEECTEYKCIPAKPAPKFLHSLEECPAVICQANYIPVFEAGPSKKEKRCPSYSCNPPPEPDAVCNVTGRTFNTFDNVEYKYDICNHILARDLEADEWDVSLKKNCTKYCSQDLIIRHDEHTFVIHPDLSLEFDGFQYNVQQIGGIGEQSDDFALSQIGDTLLFVSHRHGFWAIWGGAGAVKLGVVRKLADRVDGLCGYFNGRPDDDKRKPDGEAARTTVEFGDSWALAADQPKICEARVCPVHVQKRAWDMCNTVKEPSLSPCAVAVDIDAFISRCLESTCACMERSPDNHTAEEACRCEALQSFVVDCLSADSKIDISDWRMKQDCPTSCEAPLVYHDCYQRKCEPTCQSIADPNVCPKLDNVCFPGCYCPPGYVRKADTCIKPSSCQDCECNVLPHLKYVTYDENNFTVTGNCVYVMSRDISDEKQEHKFQVLVTNHPCKSNSEKMCIGKITILYNGHKIHVFLDEYRNKLKLVVDSERIDDFSDLSQWANVRQTVTKHLKILLRDIKVEVSVYYPSLGVSVKAPSHKYGGRLEGICGDCNGDPDNDFATPTGLKPKDENDFALSWLYDELPGGQSRERCDNKVEEDCPPAPKGLDPCSQLLDGNKFGQCLNVLSPNLFIEWCEKDSCGKRPELSCNAIEAYARDCASSGFCINWRNDLCPAKPCSADQFYDPCGTSSQKTCGDLKNNAESVRKHPIPTESCYCPQGKVLLNDTCVIPEHCVVCDNEGHHPGDRWKKDKCTNCTCEGTSLKCETQQCPSVSAMCGKGYDAVKLPSDSEECCDKYACVPEATASPTCDPPQNITCNKDQILKLDTKSNGCQFFICECKPKEECEPLDMSTSPSLEPGYVKVVDESSCCPVVNLECRKESCPPPKQCPQFYSLQKEESLGRCCPFYACSPPEDKCIYETGYAAAEEGGERPLTMLERQKFLKVANDTWKDGPCRECKCVLTNIGNYQPSCSQTDCPDLDTHPDHGEYELTARPAFGRCCPDAQRTACKHGGQTYAPGANWTRPGDRCATFSCARTPEGVRRETRVRTCDERCEPGSAYSAAAAESGECCGACRQVACVAAGVVREVGAEWRSEDACVTYYCDNVNGSVQTQAIVENCHEIDEDMNNNFVIETLPVEGQCCAVHTPIACKVEGVEYQVGQVWPSPDGDMCKTYKCVKNEKGDLSKQESVETCKKDCAKGQEYRESNSTCCGECIQVACVVDGEVKNPDETWTSPDNCTIFTCERLGDQYSVTSKQETCPAIEDCPAENVYSKGCCQFCNITSGSLTLCSPEEISIENTIGLLNISFQSHEQCTNKDPIPGFSECMGTCKSWTHFNSGSSMHDSACYCCQPTEYKHMMIELTCEDGKQWKKQIAIPTSCGCLGCESSQRFTKKAPLKTIYH